MPSAIRVRYPTATNAAATPMTARSTEVPATVGDPTQPKPE